MHLYEAQFSETHDFPRVEGPTKVLILASTGRCGSHMLGHALQTTGKFGFPLEYANPRNVEEWKKRLGIADLEELMKEIQRRRTSPNGVFGIKIHYPHVGHLGGFQNLTRMFPNAHYVLLTRSDVLRQAVSLSIAKQTGVWISGQKAVRETAQYDYSHIDQCLRETILNNSSWRYTLAASGSDHIELVFERVRRDLAQSIAEIAAFLDIEVHEADLPREQVTRMQSSDRNAEWAARFSSDFDRNRELLGRTSPSLANRLKSRVRTALPMR